MLIVLVTFSCSLAWWQYQRINEKKALQIQYQQQQSGNVISLNDFVANSEELSIELPLWQPVLAEGEYLIDFQFLLDSQVFQGKPGYHVICPFKLKDSEWIVLVNRGWLAAGSDRQLLPLIPATAQSRITGQMSKIKSAMPGFEYPQTEGSKLQLFINIDQIAKQTISPVLPMMLLLDEYSADPLQREWPKFDAKIGMHQFYVAHWLIVALASILVYLYFAFKAKPENP